MSMVTIAILGAAAVMFAAAGIACAAARARDDRRQQDRLSLAFDRAQETGRGAAGYR